MLQFKKKNHKSLFRMPFAVTDNGIKYSASNLQTHFIKKLTNSFTNYRRRGGVEMHYTCMLIHIYKNKGNNGKHKSDSTTYK
jgi:hypothetical protein